MTCLGARIRAVRRSFEKKIIIRTWSICHIQLTMVLSRKEAGRLAQVVGCAICHVISHTYIEEVRTEMQLKLIRYKNKTVNLQTLPFANYILNGDLRSRDRRGSRKHISKSQSYGITATSTPSSRDSREAEEFMHLLGHPNLMCDRPLTLDP